jgi:hypothetical protein
MSRAPNKMDPNNDQTFFENTIPSRKITAHD